MRERKMQIAKPVTKPSKQRKRLYQAPDHIRHKLMAAPLSPGLKASHNVKSLPVRKGDTVRIMRGDHKGFEGKITRVDRKNYRIYVEGLTREKVDGTTIFVPIHPSKVMITKLNLDDKWRKKVLERKKTGRLLGEKVLEKTPEKNFEVKEEIIEEKLVKEKPKRKKKTVKKSMAKKVRKKRERRKVLQERLKAREHKFG
ncbi:MAG: 50S ribosomal protein L24 [Desulfonauticus sp.]|nr:50S ribosomal protein L24 [Desulfonauticus sp.]